MTRIKSVEEKRGNGYLKVRSGLCDFCGSCVAVCPEDCIALGENTLDIEASVCSLCLNCVKICPLHIIIYEE